EPVGARVGLRETEDLLIELHHLRHVLGAQADPADRLQVDGHRSLLASDAGPAAVGHPRINAGLPYRTPGGHQPLRVAVIWPMRWPSFVSQIVSVLPVYGVLKIRPN